MTKWLLGLLLAANVVFFAVMQWSGALMADADVLSVQTPLNADKIRLVSEVASAPSVTTAVNAAPSVPASSTVFAPASILSAELTSIPKKSRQCVEWGEFSGRGLAQVQAGLAELKLGERLSQRTVEHAGGFWVYIPPLKDHAEVQRKLEQLKKRGVEDYFVVQEEGAWLNTISLGVFRTEEAAKKFFENLREKNVVSAKVGERMSKLIFTVFVLKDVDAATADKINVLRKEFPDSELKSVDCKVP